MPSSVTAFSPGHISGYFCRKIGRDPRETGSLGAGIVLKDGVTVRVMPAEATTVAISAAGEESFGSPPIEEALRRLNLQASVETVSPLPIGSGFGLSAASLLAFLLAADRLFSLNLGIHELYQMAHEIEVLHGNGLGDVAAICGGGLACRTAPGIDGVERRIFAISDSISIITAGPIATRDVLLSAETMEQVEAAYPGRCPADLMDLLRLSRRFAESSGLVTKAVRRMLNACDDAGIAASMTMLGDGVFAAGEEAAAQLSGFGKVYCTGIADYGPRLQDVVS